MKTRYLTSYLNRESESEINITPMLDVVFIMLIFFIVTTSFVMETGISIYRASHAQPQDNKVKVATIKLSAGNITVNGVATKLNGIQSLLANLKASNPDIKAQVLSAKDIKTGDLVQAIHQIKINNIDSYSVSTF
jgi:biopolymer transport protein ExbD